MQQRGLAHQRGQLAQHGGQRGQFAAGQHRPATGTAACDAINHDLNSIMSDAAKAKATGTLTVQEARQAQLASNLKKNARVFIDDQSESGITPTLRQAEKTIAGTVDSYYANYEKPNSGTYGMKIINALGQVKQECGTAPWQTAL